MFNQRRIETLKNYYAKVMNRVVQWKEIYSLWQLGTRDDVDGANRALQDLHENSMRKGVKLDALVEVLLQRGLIHPEELIEKQTELAIRLDQSLEAKFPGAKATDDGMEIDEEVFAATKASLNFPL